MLRIPSPRHGEEREGEERVKFREVQKQVGATSQVQELLATGANKNTVRTRESGTLWRPVSYIVFLFCLCFALVLRNMFVVAV